MKDISSYLDASQGNDTFCSRVDCLFHSEFVFINVEYDTDNLSLNFENFG